RAHAIAKPKTLAIQAHRYRADILAHIVNNRTRNLRATSVHAPGGQMRIGPFEILETIGSGGGGVVYRAHHTELDRVVALKQIRLAPGPEADRAAERFAREAKAMAAIESDHVVRLYSYQTIDGKPTLEMEFVDDGSVETRLGSGELGAEG